MHKYPGSTLTVPHLEPNVWIELSNEILFVLARIEKNTKRKDFLKHQSEFNLFFQKTQVLFSLAGINSINSSLLENIELRNFQRDFIRNIIKLSIACRVLCTSWDADTIFDSTLLLFDEVRTSLHNLIQARKAIERGLKSNKSGKFWSRKSKKSNTSNQTFTTSSYSSSESFVDEKCELPNQVPDQLRNIAYESKFMESFKNHKDQSGVISKSNSIHSHTLDDSTEKNIEDVIHGLVKTKFNFHDIIKDYSCNSDDFEQFSDNDFSTPATRSATRKTNESSLKQNSLTSNYTQKSNHLKRDDSCKSEMEYLIEISSFSSNNNERNVARNSIKNVSSRSSIKTSENNLQRKELSSKGLLSSKNMLVDDRNESIPALNIGLHGSNSSNSSSSTVTTPAISLSELSDMLANETILSLLSPNFSPNENSFKSHSSNESIGDDDDMQDKTFNSYNLNADSDLINDIDSPRIDNGFKTPLSPISETELETVSKNEILTSNNFIKNNHMKEDEELYNDSMMVQARLSVEPSSIPGFLYSFQVNRQTTNLDILPIRPYSVAHLTGDNTTKNESIDHQKWLNTRESKSTRFSLPHLKPRPISQSQMSINETAFIINNQTIPTGFRKNSITMDYSDDDEIFITSRINFSDSVENKYNKELPLAPQSFNLKDSSICRKVLANLINCYSTQPVDFMENLFMLTLDSLSTKTEFADLLEEMIRSISTIFAILDSLGIKDFKHTLDVNDASIQFDLLREFTLRKDIIYSDIDDIIGLADQFSIHDSMELRQGFTIVLVSIVKEYEELLLVTKCILNNRNFIDSFSANLDEFDSILNSNPYTTEIMHLQETFKDLISLNLLRREQEAQILNPEKTTLEVKLMFDQIDLPKSRGLNLLSLDSPINESHRKTNPSEFTSLQPQFLQLGDPPSINFQNSEDEDGSILAISLLTPEPNKMVSISPSDHGFNSVVNMNSFPRLAFSHPQKFDRISTVSPLLAPAAAQALFEGNTAKNHYYPVIPSDRIQAILNSQAQKTFNFRNMCSVQTSSDGLLYNNESLTPKNQKIKLINQLDSGQEKKLSHIETNNHCISTSHSQDFSNSDTYKPGKAELKGNIGLIKPYVPFDASQHSSEASPSQYTYDFFASQSQDNNSILAPSYSNSSFLSQNSELGSTALRKNLNDTMYESFDGNSKDSSFKGAISDLSSSKDHKFFTDSSKFHSLNSTMKSHNYENFESLSSKSFNLLYQQISKDSLNKSLTGFNNDRLKEMVLNSDSENISSSQKAGDSKTPHFNTKDSYENSDSDVSIGSSGSISFKETSEISEILINSNDQKGASRIKNHIADHKSTSLFLNSKSLNAGKGALESYKNLSGSPSNSLRSGSSGYLNIIKMYASSQSTVFNETNFSNLLIVDSQKNDILVKENSSVLYSNMNFKKARPFSLKSDMIQILTWATSPNGEDAGFIITEITREPSENLLTSQKCKGSSKKSNTVSFKKTPLHSQSRKSYESPQTFPESGNLIGRSKSFQENDLFIHKTYGKQVGNISSVSLQPYSTHSIVSSENHNSSMSQSPIENNINKELSGAQLCTSYSGEDVLGAINSTEVPDITFFNFHDDFTSNKEMDVIKDEDNPELITSYNSRLRDITEESNITTKEKIIIPSDSCFSIRLSSQTCEYTSNIESSNLLVGDLDSFNSKSKFNYVEMDNRFNKFTQSNFDNEYHSGLNATNEAFSFEIHSGINNHSLASLDSSHFNETNVRDSDSGFRDDDFEEPYTLKEPKFTNIDNVECNDRLLSSKYAHNDIIETETISSKIRENNFITNSSLNTIDTNSLDLNMKSKQISVARLIDHEITILNDVSFSVPQNQANSAICELSFTNSLSGSILESDPEDYSFNESVSSMFTPTGYSSSFNDSSFTDDKLSKLTPGLPNQFLDNSLDAIDLGISIYSQNITPKPGSLHSALSQYSLPSSDGQSCLNPKQQSVPDNNSHFDSDSLSTSTNNLKICKLATSEDNAIDKPPAIADSSVEISETINTIQTEPTNIESLSTSNTVMNSGKSLNINNELEDKKSALNKLVLTVKLHCGIGLNHLTYVAPHGAIFQANQPIPTNPYYIGRTKEARLARNRRLFRKGSMASSFSTRSGNSIDTYTSRQSSLGDVYSNNSSKKISPSPSSHKLSREDSGVTDISSNRSRKNSNTSDSSGEINSQSNASAKSKAKAKRMSNLSTNSGSKQYWFLSYDYEERDIVMKDGMIITGTLDALIERLTLHNEAIDSKFMETFLLTFRSFCNAGEFLDLLIDRYTLKPPNELTPEEMVIWVSHKQTAVRIRVNNILKTWLESYFYESDDGHCLKKLIEFCSGIMMDTMPSAAKRILTTAGEIYEKLKAESSTSKLTKSKTMDLMAAAAMAKLPNHLPPPPIITKSITRCLLTKSAFRITDLSPLEVARQLTIMDCRAFSLIRPHELIGLEFSKKSSTSVQHVRSMTDATNEITSMICDCILRELDIRKRCNLIKYFVLVGENLLLLKNFNSLMPIVGALNSSMIARLKKTWALLPPKFKSIFEHLRKSTDHSRNYAEYRGVLKTSSPPCLPFLGIYLTDLTFTDEGNAAFKTEEGDTKKQVNFAKFYRTVSIVQEIQKFQVPYNLIEVKQLQERLKLWMVTSNSMWDEDVFYNKSLQLEPRNKNQPALTSRARIRTSLRPLSKDKKEISLESVAYY